MGRVTVSRGKKEGPASGGAAVSMSDEKRESEQPSTSTMADSGRQKHRDDSPARREREGMAKHHMAETTRTTDRWFDTQLNKLYAEVVSEPLPKEFLELVEKLREKAPE